MQSYISHLRATILYRIIIFSNQISCPIDLLRKILEIIENMIFSLIFVLQKIFLSIAKNQENAVSGAYVSNNKHCYDAKPSATYFGVKTKILIDIHICISVPVILVNLFRSWLWDCERVIVA